MRLNRFKKFTIKKDNNKRLLVWFFIIIPVISMALGYLISRLIVLPMMNK